MKILEVRDGFIRFESDEKVELSSFLQIDGFRRYIAQVIKISKVELNYIGYAKLLFVYDGSLNEYDKTSPDISSDIKPFSFEIFSKSLEAESPVVSGHFIENEIPVLIDRLAFDKKMLVSMENSQNIEKFVSNLKQEFLAFGNVLVIDMLGIMSGDKYTASVDFRLPLNTEALEFIYEDCLTDATSDSKSLVKEIFSDLAEYSKTVPFLPFSTLKTIVDDMVDRSHVFKLLVLKNKLAKFDRLNYFAKNVSDSESINKILSLKDVVLDLSKLDSAFQNRYLSLIYSTLAKLENRPQIFVLTSNSINKKNIKNILTNENLSSVFVTYSRFKYINEIKTMFKNFVVEPSFSNNEVFKTYKTFLEAMPKDTYLLVGEATNYIPLVSLNKEFVATPEEIVIEENATDYSDLEKALDITVEKDAQTEAIDKKSEDLIEKIADDLEDVKSTEALNIFEDEEADASEENDISKESSVAEQGEFTVVHVTEQEDTIVESEIVQEEDISTSEDIVESIEENVEEIEVSKEILDLAEEAEAERSILLEEDSIVEEISEEAVEDDVISVVQDYVEEDAEVYDVIEGDSLPEATDNVDMLLEIEEENSDESLVNQDETMSTEGYSENSEIDVMSIEEDDAFAEIVELEPTEITEDDIIVEFGNEEIEESLVDPEVLEKEIAEDVDKVFMTIKEDTISDSDLDFIDELNNDAGDEIVLEEISEDNQFEELPDMIEETADATILEPLQEINDNSYEEDEDKEVLQTRSSSTPMVPVYEAEIPQEDMVVSDNFEQGDTVTHAKYGVGVVEKMIKYGTKSLYSINFDNVGRRLLDPTLTEIKKA